MSRRYREVVCAANYGLVRAYVLRHGREPDAFMRFARERDRLTLLTATCRITIRIRNGWCTQVEAWSVGTEMDDYYPRAVAEECGLPLNLDFERVATGAKAQTLGHRPVRWLFHRQTTVS